MRPPPVATICQRVVRLRGPVSKKHDTASRTECVQQTYYAAGQSVEADLQQLMHDQLAR
uniref:Uncharacterized protein n=1 Tax=Peronospora matthiolae TaxID=2874970 RepID=A0AAV1UGK4_9STRA